MIVDIGDVKRYIKPKADNTLRNMRKDDLVEYIRTLEHNYNVAVSFNENQAKYIESLGVQPKWIPVTERLPESIDEFIVMINHADMPTTLWYDCWKECWYQPEIEGGDGRKYDVTHWMPLPEPPKED